MQVNVTKSFTSLDNSINKGRLIGMGVLPTDFQNTPKQDGKPPDISTVHFPHQPDPAIGFDHGNRRQTGPHTRPANAQTVVWLKQGTVGGTDNEVTVHIQKSIGHPIECHAGMRAAVKIGMDPATVP